MDNLKIGRAYQFCVGVTLFTEIIMHFGWATKAASWSDQDTSGGVSENPKWRLHDHLGNEIDMPDHVLQALESETHS